jgi:hypothetical protein
VTRIKLIGRVERDKPIWWWGPKRRARWRADRETFMHNLSESFWNPK